METAIEDLPDPQWRLMKEAFYGSLKNQLERTRATEFANEIFAVLERHYQGLLAKILELSGR